MYRSIVATPDQLRNELQHEPLIPVVIEAISQGGLGQRPVPNLFVPMRHRQHQRPDKEVEDVNRMTDKEYALKLARLRTVRKLNTVPLPPRPLQR